MLSKISDLRVERVEVPAAESAASHHRALLPVLWRRRWTLLLAVVICLAIAGLYLLKATRIYTAHSTIYLERQGVRIMSDSQAFEAKSDSFLYTQADVFKAEPILNAALQAVDYKHMKTFAGIDNVIAWLQLDKDFHVEVGKKEDIVTVSMDSPYPEEAAQFVNAVVDSYVTYQSKQKRTTAAEMLKILQKEKNERDQELDQRLKDMLDFKKANGALSFQDNDKGNIILERLATLSNTLTAAELITLDLSTQKKQAQAILADPEMVKAYIESQQTKEQNGDKELQGLRDQAQQLNVLLATTDQVMGARSQRRQIYAADMKMVQAQIAAKERRLVEAHLLEVSQELAAAQEKEKQLRLAFADQQKEALDLNAKAAEYQRLDADVDRTQKQCDLLDSRIKEVNVNSEDAGALNIQVLEAARTEDKPTKPRVSMTLSVAMLLGMLLGTAMALVLDWLDQTLRSSEDVSMALGVPMLGLVPHMRGKLSQAERGQVIHQNNSSDVAEAYRTIRTALHYGTSKNVKTILLTSPAPSDGKSTSASNLAIALAQTGHRTLLLDSDLRKPVQHKIYNLHDKAGISDVLGGTAKLRDVIYPSGIARLSILPVGSIPRNPSEMMTSNRFAQVMESLIEGFDRIVIDTPPVMSVADARILASAADASILVVRCNKSKRKLSMMALEGLQSVGAKVVGVIVNDIPRGSREYGYGKYGTYGVYGASTGRNEQRKLSIPVAASSPEHGPGADPSELPADSIVLQ